MMSCKKVGREKFLMWNTKNKAHHKVLHMDLFSLGHLRFAPVQSFFVFYPNMTHLRILASFFYFSLFCSIERFFPYKNHDSRDETVPFGNNLILKINLFYFFSKAYKIILNLI